MYAQSHFPRSCIQTRSGYQDRNTPWLSARRTGRSRLRIRPSSSDLAPELLSLRYHHPDPVGIVYSSADGAWNKYPARGATHLVNVHFVVKPARPFRSHSPSSVPNAQKYAMLSFKGHDEKSKARPFWGPKELLILWEGRGGVGFGSPHSVEGRMGSDSTWY